MMFIGFCILMATHFMMFRQLGDWGEFSQGVVVLLVCLAYPAFTAYIVKKYRRKLKTKWAQQRFGALYEQINVKKSPGAKFYHSIFLFRRVIICLLPIADYQNITPYLVLIFCHQVYLILYAYVLDTPHDMTRLQRIEMANEFIFMLILVTSLMLTDLANNCVWTNLNESAWLQLTMSNVVLGLIALIFVGNMAIYLTRTGGDIVDLIRKKLEERKPKGHMYEQFFITDMPDNQAARKMIRDMSWDDLVMVKAKYDVHQSRSKHDKHYLLSVSHKKLMNVAQQEIDYRLELCHLNATYFVQLKLVDEFGHEYSDEKVRRRIVWEAKNKNKKL